jgi:hypothetical protein
VKAISIAGIEILSKSVNPIVVSQAERDDSVTCEEDHPLVKCFEIPGVEDYRCKKCLKRHLKISDGVLKCFCENYYICPTCEENELAAKTKKSKEVFCTSCKKLPEQSKKYQRIFICPAEKHYLMMFTEPKIQECSLHCESGHEVTVLGCKCGYGLCSSCCKELTEANKVDNPIFGKSRCVKSGHEMYTWANPSETICARCEGHQPSHSEILVCPDCYSDDAMCMACVNSYSVGPLIKFQCCSDTSHAIILERNSTLYEYNCDFCQNLRSKTIPYYMYPSHAGMNEKNICDECVKTHIVKYLPQITSGFGDFFFNSSIQCKDSHIMTKLPSIQEFRDFAGKDPRTVFPCSKCKKPQVTNEAGWFYRCKKDCKYELCSSCVEKDKFQYSETFKKLKERANGYLVKLKKLDPQLLTNNEASRKWLINHSLTDTEEDKLLLDYYQANKETCDELLQKLIEHHNEEDSEDDDDDEGEKVDMEDNDFMIRK